MSELRTEHGTGSDIEDWFDDPAPMWAALIFTLYAGALLVVIGLVGYYGIGRLS